MLTDLGELRQQSITFVQQTLRPLHWLALEAVTQQAFHGIEDPKSLVRDLFPAVFCAASGGQMAQAVPLIASWRMYMLASMLFDDAADADRFSKNTRWKDWPQAQLLSVAIAVFSIAHLCLTRLEESPVYAKVLTSVSEGVMWMTHGQSHPPTQPSVEAYCRHIAAKAGLFYAVFARAGASLSTSNHGLLQAAFDYGMALGNQRQIVNDLKNFNLPYAQSDLAAGMPTLPVLCALRRLSGAQAATFQDWLASPAAHWPEIQQTIFTEAQADCLHLANVQKGKAQQALQLFPAVFAECLALALEY